MVFTVIKIRLERYKKMAVFAKSIELITLTSLKILKSLFLDSKNSSATLLCSLFQCNSKYFIDASIVVPYSTDKNCSGIMNNRLVVVLEELIKTVSLKNIGAKVLGTGMTFKKKWLKSKAGETGVIECIGNIYCLSNETFTFYKAYSLYRYIILLEAKGYYVLFNKY